MPGDAGIQRRVRAEDMDAVPFSIEALRHAESLGFGAREDQPSDPGGGAQNAA